MPMHFHPPALGYCFNPIGFSMIRTHNHLFSAILFLNDRGQLYPAHILPFRERSAGERTCHQRNDLHRMFPEREVEGKTAEFLPIPDAERIFEQAAYFRGWRL
jgi:hypothetical protein